MRVYCRNLTCLFSAQATTSNTACEGVTCGNKGFCVPSTLYNKGYWCECDDGWVGQNCGHPQPTVVCGDTEISITIDQVWFVLLSNMCKFLNYIFI